MNGHGPPGRRTRPGSGDALSVDVADDSQTLPLTAVVVPLHGALDPRRREQLQLALDAVPLSTGYAAGLASVYLPLQLGPARARRRLAELRALWHADVDRSIDRALMELIA